MNDFTISWQLSKQDEPYAVNEERLFDAPLLWAAFHRFMSEYQGIFFIPVPEGELELWFDYDLSHTFDHLPLWLDQLASKPGEEAVLLFGSQGTELELIAVRTDDQIVLSVETIVPGQKPSSDTPPLIVPAGRFLSEWKRFLGAVLDALEQFEPKLADDREFRDYRNALDQIPEGAEITG